MNEGQLSRLLDELTIVLRDQMPREVLSALVLYRAAAELLVAEWEGRAPDEMRFATSHMVLQALGVNDPVVEVAKARLQTGAEPENLHWRN